MLTHEVLSGVDFPGLLSKKEKNRKSIFQQVYLKIAKKSLDAQVNPTDKPVSLTLNYYEAYELERRLQDEKREGYEKNALAIVINELNQKLA